MVSAVEAFATGEAEEARHRRRGAVLEDAIRSAAVSELAEVGYGAFSIESVAMRAGTGKASIYRRWPSKQLLVMDSVCALAAENCAPQLTLSNLPEDMSTIDALRMIGRRIRGVMSGPVGDIMRDLIGEADRDPDLSEALSREFHAPRKAAMVELFERGVARGEVRPGLRAEMIAELLPAILSHRIIVGRLAVTDEDVDRIVDEVLVPLLRSCAG